MSYETAKGRLEEATPGKWQTKNKGVFIDLGRGFRAWICEAFDDDNAEFIAHSRQDMEALLELFYCVREVAYTNKEDGDYVASQRMKAMFHAMDKFEELS